MTTRPSSARRAVPAVKRIAGRKETLDTLIERKLSRKLAPLQREIKSLRADIEAIEDASAIHLLETASVEERFPAAVVRQLVSGECPIRVFREYRGLTQAALAAAAGTNAQYVSQIERGDRDVGKKLLPKLAAALGVDTADLR